MVVYPGMYSRRDTPVGVPGSLPTMVYIQAPYPPWCIYTGSLPHVGVPGSLPHVGVPGSLHREVYPGSLHREVYPGSLHRWDIPRLPAQVGYTQAPCSDMCQKWLIPAQICAKSG